MEFIANAENVALERMHVISFTKIGSTEAKKDYILIWWWWVPVLMHSSSGNKINSKTHNKYSDMNLEEAKSHVCWHLCALKWES